MNSLDASRNNRPDNRQHLLDKMAYIKARQKGFMPNAAFEKKVAHGVQEIDQVIVDVVDVLFKTQAEAEQLISKSTAIKVEALSLEEIQTDVNRNELAMQSSDQDVENMKFLVGKAKKELALQHQHTNQLLAHMEKLREQLKKPTRFQNFASQAGEKVCIYAVRGEMPYVDVAREKRMEELRPKY